MNKEKTTSYLKLFSTYFWIGIVLILLAIIIETKVVNPAFSIKVLISAMESIGIAVLVASIFTFASGTSEFVNKIRLLLQDIVVSRNFLGNIDAQSKREALSSLIKPSNEEKRIYSNIEDYLNTYITQTMAVTSKCVRSNYNVYARAFIDYEKQCVFVESNITYRLYPTKDGYNDIRVGFLESEQNSTCSKVIVNTPHGIRKVYDNLEFKPITIDAGKARLATVDLSEHAKNCSHLDISLDMLEAGTDHWIMLSFGALMPTDGFKYHLRCDDGLEINRYHTFIHGAQFYTDEVSNRELVTSCTEWVNEGTGLAMLISLPHKVLTKEVIQ